MRLKKGDTVIVLAGKDKNKKGKILSVSPADDKVTVERVNVVKKHQKASQKFQGGIIEKTKGIPASKVMLVCPRCGDPTRVSVQVIDKKRRRVCKECQELIDKE